MLSDEEKKAIENLKEVIDLYNDECLITTDDDFKSIEILLNLIEKLSKEIEEYKKQLDLDYVDEHFVPIERYNQLEKEIEELKEENKTLKNLQNDTNRLYTEMIERKNYFERELQKLEDKIKAKIEEQDKIIKTGGIDFNTKSYARCKKEFGQSLLEKE